MKCFIKIKDGEPFEHPIIETNFIQVFPEIDLNNLPPNFAEFERVPQPEIGVYEVYEGVHYEWNEGKVKDVHKVRIMTPEEKQNKIDTHKKIWAQLGKNPSWIFNEDECRYEAPIPYPNDNQIYVWDESILNWKPIQTQTIEGQ